MCETSLSAPDRQRDALSTRQVTDQEAPVRASPRTKTSLPHRSPNATVHAAGLTASYGKAGVLTGDLDFRALPGTEAVYPARAPFDQKQQSSTSRLASILSQISSARWATQHPQTAANQEAPAPAEIGS